MQDDIYLPPYVEFVKVWENKKTQAQLLETSINLLRRQLKLLPEKNPLTRSPPASQKMSTGWPANRWKPSINIPSSPCVNLARATSYQNLFAMAWAKRTDRSQRHDWNFQTNYPPAPRQFNFNLQEPSVKRNRSIFHRLKKWGNPGKPPWTRYATSTINLWWNYQSSGGYKRRNPVSMKILTGWKPRIRLRRYLLLFRIQ